MQIIFFLIAIGASTIGAISGIGGGVIIKPVLDSLGVYSVSTVSFLSGCTVLAMALSSYLRNIKSKAKVDYKISLYLAIGASIGGFIGKQIFSSSSEYIGLIQAILLLTVNVLVMIYVLNKNRIKTLSVENSLLCMLIGLTLGAISAFLGIGGGPINIAVLYYFFSMNSKDAARSSLFVILFSQITSLITTILTNTVPQYNLLTLILMCSGGILGAIIGGRVSKKLHNDNTEKVFIYVLIALIVINIYNVIKFTYS